MWCFVSLFFVVSTGTVDCLESLVSEITCYCVEWDVRPYTLTHPKESGSCPQIRTLFSLSVVLWKYQVFRENALTTDDVVEVHGYFKFVKEKSACEHSVTKKYTC